MKCILGIIKQLINYLLNSYVLHAFVKQDLEGVEEFIREHRDTLVAIGEVCIKDKSVITPHRLPTCW